MSKRPNKIAELRNAHSLSQEDLAEAVGIHWTTLSRIENKPLNLRNRTVQKIAQKFHVAPQDLLNLPEGHEVLIRGSVQAGYWSDRPEWPEDERYTLIIPAIEGFEGKNLQGSVVEGMAMNELYPHGSIVVWVHVTPSSNDPLPGRRYIVERGLDGEFETTLKEFHIDSKGHKWLIPRTTDAGARTPLALNGDGNETIRLVGRVVWSIRREDD